MNPLISVIIPNYNHERFLAKRMETVLAQTYSNFEIIILDDFSTDNSLNILAEYKAHPKVKSIESNNVNSGSAFVQWKKGIEKAKGELIWIAESDDYSSNNFLESCIDVFNNDETIGLVYCQTRDVDENDKVIYDRINYTTEFLPNIWNDNFMMSGKEFVSKYFKVKNVVPNASAVVFKRSLIDVKEHFNETLLNMKHAGDWFFWIQLCRKTKIAFINQKLNYFRDLLSSTRKHTSKEITFKRLSEEKHIRTYLTTHFPEVNQTEEWMSMADKWFKYHNRKSVLTSSFYAFKNPALSKFAYVRRFLAHLKNSK